MQNFALSKGTVLEARNSKWCDVTLLQHICMKLKE